MLLSYGGSLRCFSHQWDPELGAAYHWSFGNQFAESDFALLLELISRRNHLDLLMSYRNITIPLTLLSAYLILWAPRSKQEAFVQLASANVTSP